MTGDELRGRIRGYMSPHLRNRIHDAADALDAEQRRRVPTALRGHVTPEQHLAALMMPFTPSTDCRPRPHDDVDAMLEFVGW